MGNNIVLDWLSYGDASNSHLRVLVMHVSKLVMLWDYILVQVEVIYGYGLSVMAHLSAMGWLGNGNCEVLSSWSTVFVGSSAAPLQNPLS